MPFGPTNSPATFINYIHDVNSQWKVLATFSCINISKDSNTRVIVDNIISHGDDLNTSLQYMECQLHVCCSYHLLLSLKKNFVFPKQYESVGNDICADRTCPAQSKYQLLSTWSGRALFGEFTLCTGIFRSGKEMLAYICTSGDNSPFLGI
jgi:hypothetical protein